MSSSSKLAAAKARFAAAGDKARRQAALNLAPNIGGGFYITPWSHKAAEAYRDQWLTADPPSESGWDWEEIFRRYRGEPDRLEMVIWAGARLCGLGLATTSNQAVTVRFMEGDPRPDCPFKGKRALICLEAATCYAQERGRTELRLEPLNPRLAELYKDVYGFVLETPYKGSAYYKKGV